ncbi:MAG: RecQ family ATP-dependent DNA helicase [Flavobacteriales bacterium]|nr:RecQ family ATP-dependent DNA helicase [Flavobacteriales bacterium]
MAVPHDILKQYWGYDAFRPKQEDIVRAVLDGRDTLALLATGGGKSICFQVPAMCMEGICVVISPLLALMNDQVANLVKKGIDAVAVNSAMSMKEIDRVLDNCVYGKVKFLYVSPERLQNEMFLARFKKMNVSMIAVDESHCVSQWGYDFRPDYLNIASIREFKPSIPVLALTASATPAVVQDIQEKLKFKSLNVIGTGFARANLSYNVSHQEDKEGKLLEICKKMKGCGIVYCGTRLRTRDIAQLLVRHGMSSAAYNAGMSVKEREKAFKSWMKNEVRIMCATNAFGMGIDKPDVRFVVHADVPADPESYFQEAGRAGRDGQRAYAILLWNEADVLRLYKNVDQKYPERDYIKRVYRAIGGYLKIAPGNGKDIAYPFGNQ